MKDFKEELGRRKELVIKLDGYALACWLVW
jgi:hypothetical protein